MSDNSSPDLQPTLAGETVTIRPIQIGDWAEMFAAASDPLIWELHPAKNRYQEAVFKEFFADAIKSNSAFAFIDRANGQIIGSSRYHGHDPERSEIEIGWTFLVRDKWGGKANREIKKLMIDHAFTFVDTVVFWVGETNWRSQRALEKIGARRRDGIVFRAAGGDPHVVFEITQKDFRL